MKARVLTIARSSPSASVQALFAALSRQRRNHMGDQGLVYTARQLILRWSMARFRPRVTEVSLGLSEERVIGFGAAHHHHFQVAELIGYSTLRHACELAQDVRELSGSSKLFSPTSITWECPEKEFHDV